ncbi:MAG: hypothetical protein MUP55_02240 [Candidatus Aenigmarchaeota archaeon]|nr:hypothetical protein [Candidatus Aenigmarchaeota archaeon]
MIFDRKKNREERLRFIDFWADYVRTHPDRDWSMQQKILIDSMIKSSRSWKWTPEDYLRMKEEL